METTIVELFDGIPYGALAAIFIAAFLDGVVLIGLFINGWLLFGVSLYFYVNGQVGIQYVALCAVAGAISGDHLGYILGRTFQQPLLQRLEHLLQYLSSKWQTVKQFFRLGTQLEFRSPESNQVARIKQRIARFDIAGVAICRFTPARSITPVVCAVYGMSATRFFIADVSACLLWVSVWTTILWIVASGLISISV